MSFWDNVVDGFKSGLMGKGPSYVKKERERQARELEGLMAQAVLRAWSNYQDERRAQSRWREGASKQGGANIQYVDGDVKVVVLNGYDGDRDQYTSDIKVFHRDPNIRQHLHVIFDEQGNEIFRQWRDDK